MTPSNIPTLTLTRVFDAPRQLVFEAWTQKEHLDKWCCPRGFTIASSEGEPRPGGKWHTRMIAPNGEPYPLRGVYQEFVPHDYFTTTHIWEEDDGTPEHETLLTVRFTDEGGKTKVTLEQIRFKSVESRDGHQGGWSECLDKLGEHLAKIVAKKS
jgi:uncharacterized protein YndB with AHSA1/START domain